MRIGSLRRSTTKHTRQKKKKYVWHWIRGSIHCVTLLLSFYLEGGGDQVLERRDLALLALISMLPLFRNERCFVFAGGNTHPFFGVVFFSQLRMSLS